MRLESVLDDADSGTKGGGADIRATGGARPVGPSGAGANCGR